MKILILGAKGMLGSALMRIFKDFNPIGWDKEEINIADQRQVFAKIKKINPKIIINAAAYTDVDGCESNKELAFKVNGYALEYLAKVSLEIDAVLVHYSTDYVFDGQKKEGYLEEDKPNPLSVYGESKALGEELLKKFGKKYYLIRTSWLFGPFGKNFVNTILKLVQEKESLKVVNDQWGKPTFSFDLASHTQKLIKKSPSFGIYHFSNEGVTNWFLFAKKILEIKNISTPISPVTTKEYPRPAKRPKYSILINSKFEPLREWPLALKEYLTKFEFYKFS